MFNPNRIVLFLATYVVVAIAACFEIAAEPIAPSGQPRRPSLQNTNCHPAIQTYRGTPCYCCYICAKPSGPNGTWERYEYLCDPNRGPGDPATCDEHEDCEPAGPPAPPPGRSTNGDEDLPRYGIYQSPFPL